MTDLMTRDEWLRHWRSAMVTLTDHELGVYVLHFTGLRTRYIGAGRDQVQGVEPESTLHLYFRLHPPQSHDRLREPLSGSTPEERTLRRGVAGALARLGSMNAKVRQQFDADMLVLGQRARDILTGNPTMMWTVTEERRRLLEARLPNLESNASRLEREASSARHAADAARAELDEVFAEQSRLTLLALETPA